MKRHLKAWVEKTLIFINMYIFIFTFSIDDFEFSAIPYIIGMWCVFCINAKIINKYGVIWNSTKN